MTGGGIAEYTNQPDDRWRTKTDNQISTIIATAFCVGQFVNRFHVSELIHTPHLAR